MLLTHLIQLISIIHTERAEKNILIIQVIIA